MKTVVIYLLLGPFLFCYSSLTAQGIKDLDFLIGVWEHEETIFPGTGRQYTEEGRRECEYVLNDTYIKCESKSTNQKGSRSYWFLINYEEDRDYFKVISFYSDYDFYWKYNWYLDKEQRMIRAISETKPTARQFFRSTIKYSEDQFVWEGFRSRFKEDMEWVMEFREISKKVEK